MTGFSSRTRAQDVQTCCSISYGTPDRCINTCTLFGTCSWMFVGCRMVIASFTVVVSVWDEQARMVKKQLPGGDNSDESGQRKLHVLFEAREADADQAQRAGPVT